MIGNFNPENTLLYLLKGNETFFLTELFKLMADGSYRPQDVVIALSMLIERGLVYDTDSLMLTRADGGVNAGNCAHHSTGNSKITELSNLFPETQTGYELSQLFSTFQIDIDLVRRLKQLVVQSGLGAVEITTQTIILITILYQIAVFNQAQAYSSSPVKDFLLLFEDPRLGLISQQFPFLINWFKFSHSDQLRSSRNPNPNPNRNPNNEANQAGLNAVDLDAWAMALLFFYLNLGESGLEGNIDPLIAWTIFESSNRIDDADRYTQRLETLVPASGLEPIAGFVVPRNFDLNSDPKASVDLNDPNVAANLSQAGVWQVQASNETEKPASRNKAENMGTGSIAEGIIIKDEIPINDQLFTCLLEFLELLKPIAGIMYELAIKDHLSLDRKQQDIVIRLLFLTYDQPNVSHNFMTCNNPVINELCQDQIRSWINSLEISSAEKLALGILLQKALNYLADHFDTEVLLRQGLSGTDLNLTEAQRQRVSELQNKDPFFAYLWKVFF